MCGIVGVVNALGATKDDVWKMIDCIKYRGVDEQGVEDLGQAVLGHARLAVVDPENGMQPPEALGGLDLNQAAKSFRNYQFVATMQDTGNLCWLGIFVTTRLITLWPNKVEMQ